MNVKIPIHGRTGSLVMNSRQILEGTYEEKVALFEELAAIDATKEDVIRALNSMMDDAKRARALLNSLGTDELTVDIGLPSLREGQEPPTRH